MPHTQLGTLLATKGLKARNPQHYLPDLLGHNSTGLVWGKKKSGLPIKLVCALLNRPYFCVEDGFIGYTNHPTSNRALLSLVVDSRGIYYDATRPSDLEHFIKEEATLTPQSEKRVAALRSAICTHGITKYNLRGTPSKSPTLPAEFILLIDQTVGDLSIKCSYASKHRFQHMLDAALVENPSMPIVVKTHPDVLLGRKRGHLQDAHLQHSRVRVIADPVNPYRLMEHCTKVYTVCSQMGFEALIAGKPVVTFGTPFYACWD